MPSAATVKAVFVTVGLCALLVGLVWFGSTGLRRAQWRSASGMVVGHEPESSSTRTGGRSQGLFAPIISFNASDGRTVQFTSSEYAAQSLYPLGRQVTVLYDPARPERAEIDSLQTTWMAGALWTIGGLACIAAGFAAARVMGRQPG